MGYVGSLGKESNPQPYPPKYFLSILSVQDMFVDLSGATISSQEKNEESTRRDSSFSLEQHPTPRYLKAG